MSVFACLTLGMCVCVCVCARAPVCARVCAASAAAVGLPVSSFPNANTSAMRFHGKTLVETGDFIRTGFPVSAMVLVLINTVGFGLCMMYGF